MQTFTRVAMALLLALGLTQLTQSAESNLQFSTKSKPDKCSSFATQGDQVRVEFSLADATTKEDYITSRLMSYELGGDDTILAFTQGVIGMCVGEVRTVLFPNSVELGYPSERGHMLLPMIGQYFDEIRWNQGKWLFATIKLTQLSSEEDYAIFKAIADGEINEALRTLKSPTMDVAMVDSTGQSPLMAAIAVQMVQVYAMILNMQPAVLSQAEHVNIAKSTGHTALFYAVNQPDPTLVKVLLKKGADPNKSLKSGGWTPMHFAAMLGNADHLKVMLDFGGDPYAVTHDGSTILDCVDLGEPRVATTGFKTRIVNILNEAIDDLDEADESIALGTSDEL